MSYSSKSALPHPGMRSFSRGIVPVVVKNFSNLIARYNDNEGRLNSKNYKDLYCAYGPFTVGDVDLEVCLYPVGGDKVHVHVNLLSNKEAITKFCFSVLYYNNGHKKWIFSSTDSEKDFKADAIGAGIGLPVVNIDWFSEDFTEDDHLLFDLALWFALDDSKKVPMKPEQAVVHPHHPWPEVCPDSELLTALLNGDFADIHFVVGGQTFSTHRAVLAARSSVFRSEFLALKQDVSQKGVFVSIQHMNAFTFKQLLHFIYTDSLVPDIDQPAASTADILKRYRCLFIAAHRFNIQGITKICEKKLTGAVIDCLLSTLDEFNFQDCGLLKIVPKNSVGDHLCSTMHVGKESM